MQLARHASLAGSVSTGDLHASSSSGGGGSAAAAGAKKESKSRGAPPNPRLNKAGGSGLSASFSGSVSTGQLPPPHHHQQQQRGGEASPAAAALTRPLPPQLSLHAANIGRYYRYTPYGSLTESLLEERDALCAGLQQLRGTLEAWERGRIEELTRYEIQVRRCAPCR